MDPERLEAFRRGYLATNEAFNRHDWDGAFGLMRPEFEWHTFRDVPESRVARGPEGARRLFEELLLEFPDWQAEVRDFVPAGDDQVVVLCVGRARGRASGAPVETEFAQVWEFEDGRPRRLREYRSHAEALAAAGVERSPG